MPVKKPAAPTSATPERPKLLLIDGHSVAYRAFFALPVENFATQTGQHTNGVFGFTSMLINVLRDEVPTHLAVAFDVSRKTFRSEIYTEYKANRSTSPDEFKGQVDLVKEVLDALNVPHVAVDGYEADDVIATLATQAEAADFGQPTAAMTRWRVSVLPSEPLPAPGVGRARWLVELIRARAGESADFELEACDAKGRLALPADLVHGPAAAEARRHGTAG